jgi:hypothetical protein
MTILLRDNLERIQRNADELHQAVADVVAACSSARPTNALPPMLRAQTSAASLCAALEVLSRFVAVTLQPGARSPFEAEIARLAGSVTGTGVAEAHAQALAAAPAAPPAHEPAHAPAPDPPRAAQSKPAAIHKPAPPPTVEHRAEPMLEAPAPEPMEVETAPVAAGESEVAAAFNVGLLSAE